MDFYLQMHWFLSFRTVNFSSLSSIFTLLLFSELADSNRPRLSCHARCMKFTFLLYFISPSLYYAICLFHAESQINKIKKTWKEQLKPHCVNSSTLSQHSLPKAFHYPTGYEVTILTWNFSGNSPSQITDSLKVALQCVWNSVDLSFISKHAEWFLHCSNWYEGFC